MMPVRILAFLLLAGLSVGCYPSGRLVKTDPPVDPKTRELPPDFLKAQGNPTSYAFHASIAKVSEAVKQGLSEQRYRNMRLDWQGTPFVRSVPVWFWLGFGQSRSWPSKAYYRKVDGHHEPVAYRKEFVIQLLENKESTEVMVRAEEPFRDGTVPCLVEMTCLTCTLGHVSTLGSYYPSSTVEEYEILLLIGKELGEPDMPPIRYPQVEVKER